MPIGFDSAFGPLPQALQLAGRRTEVLASNIANADTPGFKARDFDFRAAMGAALDGQIPMRRTHAAHLSLSGSPGNPVALLYRTPQQPSLDGNTVDTQVEQAEFARNAVHYQATLTFLSGRISSLKDALRGE